MLDARSQRPTRDLPALPLDQPPDSPVSLSQDQAEPVPTSSTLSQPHDNDSAGPPAVPEKSASLSAEEHSARTPTEDTALSPLRAHYLKKSLVELQFDYELDAITTAAPNNISTFSYLGAPFSRPPRGAPALELPFLRYVFRQFVLTFPFLAAAPKDFFPDKLQPFMASVMSRNLSPASVMDDEDAPGGDTAARMRLRHKLQRNLALFIGAATKLAEREEVVRLSQADLDRLEALAKRRQAREARSKGVVFEVNVACVRTVVERHRMRSKAHEVRRGFFLSCTRGTVKLKIGLQEFIIRTRRSGQEDVFVSRRYGDFKTLADEVIAHNTRHAQKII